MIFQNPEKITLDEIQFGSSDDDHDKKSLEGGKSKSIPGSAMQNPVNRTSVGTKSTTIIPIKKVIQFRGPGGASSSISTKQIDEGFGALGTKLTKGSESAKVSRHL